MPIKEPAKYSFVERDGYTLLIAVKSTTVLLALSPKKVLINTQVNEEDGELLRQVVDVILASYPNAAVEYSEFYLDNETRTLYLNKSELDSPTVNESERILN